MVSFISVKDSVRFAYYDSGKPEGTLPYTTLFVVHGLGFGGLVFSKILAIAPATGIRVVSINRPGYFGSSPLSETQAAVLQTGTDQEKAALLRECGHDLVMFIHKFVQMSDIPAVSEDGKSGGFGILGWSLGCTAVLAAVANIPSMASDVQLRFKSGLRSVILHEPPTGPLGLPRPPSDWFPFYDESCSMSDRMRMFQQWVTAYFRHKSTTSHNHDDLTRVVPATFRTPTIFNIPESDQANFVESGQAPYVDLALAGIAPSTLKENLETVCYSQTVKGIIPRMRVVLLAGDCAPSFAPATLWQIQDMNKAHGGQPVECKLISGFNHFPHWDEPVRCLDVYIESLSNIV